MTPKVKKMLEFLRAREYRAQRACGHLDVANACQGLDGDEQSLVLLKEALKRETLVLYEGDIFAFNKSRSGLVLNGKPLPNVFRMNNITVNYDRVISQGFDSILEDIEEGEKNADEAQKKYYISDRNERRIKGERQFKQ